MAHKLYKIVIVDGEGNRWSREDDNDTALWEAVATETSGLCADGAAATVYRRVNDRWEEDWVEDGEALRRQLLRENFEVADVW